MERRLSASFIVYTGPSGGGECADGTGLCVFSIGSASPSCLVWSSIYWLSAGLGESATCTGVGSGGVSVSVSSLSTLMVSLAIVGRPLPVYCVVFPAWLLAWSLTETPGR